MFDKGHGHMLFLILAVLLPGIACAQPRSAGITFCFSGIGLSYEQQMSDDSFGEFCLRAETSEIFLGREGKPGVSTSFTWNLVLQEWKTVDSCSIRMFAGPGAMIGFGRDYKNDSGLFYGLKGRFGVEMHSARGVCISVCIAPVVGQHIVRLEESLATRYYKNGLIYGLAPEIGMKYCF